MSGTLPDQSLTIPRGYDRPRVQDVLKQVPIRLHVHDHTMLRAMLKKDRMTVQKFIGFCVRGYLDADPMMLKMLRNYRELEAVPRDIQDKHVLSHRERLSILDEIEASEKESEP